MHYGDVSGEHSHANQRSIESVVYSDWGDFSVRNKIDIILFHQVAVGGKLTQS